MEGVVLEVPIVLHAQTVADAHIATPEEVAGFVQVTLLQKPSTQNPQKRRTLLLLKANLFTQIPENPLQKNRHR